VLELVRKPAGQRGFVLLPRRGVVERTFAGLVRCRRLARDYERRTERSEAMVHLAMIRLMLRRLRPA
jgi:putative transposase